MEDKGGRDVHDESVTRTAADVADVAPEPEIGSGPDTAHDRSARAIKGVLLALKAGPLFILALMMLFLWAATEATSS